MFICLSKQISVNRTTEHALKATHLYGIHSNGIVMYYVISLMSRTKPPTATIQFIPINHTTMYYMRLLILQRFHKRIV